MRRYSIQLNQSDQMHHRMGQINVWNDGPWR
jgi:hypothetical protein